MADIPVNEYGLPDLSNVPVNELTFEEVQVERKILYNSPYEKIDQFMVFNGMRYIRTYTRWGTSALPRPDIYSFRWKRDGEKRTMYLAKKNPETGEWVEIASGIPHTRVSGGETYIPLQYYANTLMPLMDETE